MRSANGYAIRDFLPRCDIPFEWLEPGSDKDAEELAARAASFRLRG